MEYVWVLYVCAGISGWGCGAIQRSPMPSLDTCITQMQSFSLQTNGSLATGEDSQAAYANCILYGADDAPPHPSSWNIKD